MAFYEYTPKYNTSGLSSYVSGMKGAADALIKAGQAKGQMYIDLAKTGTEGVEKYLKDQQEAANKEALLTQLDPNRKFEDVDKYTANLQKEYETALANFGPERAAEVIQDVYDRGNLTEMARSAETTRNKALAGADMTTQLKMLDIARQQDQDAMAKEKMGWLREEQGRKRQEWADADTKKAFIKDYKPTDADRMQGRARDVYHQSVAGQQADLSDRYDELLKTLSPEQAAEKVQKEYQPQIDAYERDFAGMPLTKDDVQAEAKRAYMQAGFTPTEAAAYAKTYGEGRVTEKGILDQEKARVDKLNKNAEAAAKAQKSLLDTAKTFYKDKVKDSVNKGSYDSKSAKDAVSEALLAQVKKLDKDSKFLVFDSEQEDAIDDKVLGIADTMLKDNKINSTKMQKSLIESAFTRMQLEEGVGKWNDAKFKKALAESIADVKQAGGTKEESNIFARMTSKDAATREAANQEYLRLVTPKQYTTRGFEQIMRDKLGELPEPGKVKSEVKVPTKAAAAEVKVPTEETTSEIDEVLDGVKGGTANNVLGFETEDDRLDKLLRSGKEVKENTKKLLKKRKGKVIGTKVIESDAVMDDLKESLDTTAETGGAPRMKRKKTTKGDTRSNADKVADVVGPTANYIGDVLENSMSEVKKDILDGVQERGSKGKTGLAKSVNPGGNTNPLTNAQQEMDMLKNLLIPGTKMMSKEDVQSKLELKPGIDMTKAKSMPKTVIKPEPKLIPEMEGIIDFYKKDGMLSDKFTGNLKNILSSIPISVQPDVVEMVIANKKAGMNSNEILTILGRLADEYNPMRKYIKQN
jgi:hypothetical protein